MLCRLVVASAILALVAAENSVHWQWRDLTCKTRDGKGVDKVSKEQAECGVSLRETETDEKPRPANLNACFDETVPGTKQVRTYCNIFCPNADTVYIIKRNPSTHRSCFTHITFNRERRGNDWYLWREKNCRFSEIQFTIRCEFNFGRSKFPSDAEVFKQAVVKKH